jgi:serine/threonine protein kinase
LNDLLALNMPYGGTDIDTFIERVIYERIIIINFNDRMIDLLINGIVPMNKKGIYHGDLKSNNILVNVENNKLLLRIIDWGLSAIYMPEITNESQFSESGFRDNWKFIPSKFRDRPFQFNVPFSSILFSKKFNDIYSNFLILKNGKFTNKDIKDFVISFFQDYVDTYKSGHLSTFNSIFKYHIKLISLLSEDSNSIRKMNKKVYTNIDYIYAYIYEILIKFTKPYSFDVLGYFSRVYTKNLDIWGFVMAYVSLCDNAINITYEVYNDIVKDNMKSLLDILLKYSDRPIDISEIKKTILIFNSRIETKKMKKERTRKNRS